MGKSGQLTSGRFGYGYLCDRLQLTYVIVRTGNLFNGTVCRFPCHDLVFREYLTFHDLQANDPTLNRKEEFQKYLRMGGFPAIHTADYGYEAIYKIVYDIYSSVILRDTVQRHNIRNVELLERVVKFVFDNIGNKLNAKNIADYFKSQQRKVDMNTIYNYLNALESAFIIQRIPGMILKERKFCRRMKSIL